MKRSRRTDEFGPTSRFVWSRNCRPATRAGSLRMFSLAWTPAPTESVPATLPCAAGRTLLAVPICCWAAAGKPFKAKRVKPTTRVRMVDSLLRTGGENAPIASVYHVQKRPAVRQVTPYRRWISQVDKLVDSPVERAVKFELVINLKTAKALGLEVPATLLATADEVIE